MPSRLRVRAILSFALLTAPLGACAASNPVEGAIAADAAAATVVVDTMSADNSETAKPTALHAAAADVEGGDPPGSVWIDDLTSPEIAERLTTGWTTILVPTGGTEQNGPHMALGKHNVVVAHTAEEIARRAGQTLVAPVMHYVPEGDPATMSGHLQWAGTISVPDPVFAQVLESTAASLAGHGFTTIVFVGDSGSSQDTQVSVATALDGRWPGVTVANLGDYYSANGQLDWLANQGIPATTVGTHAGARDTSEVLALRPDAVRMELAGIGTNPGSLDPNGRDGDATLANAAWGHELLELKITAGVAQLEALRSS